MRRATFAVASSLLLAVASVAPSAHAEVAYSYEIENAGVRPDKVLVVWPRTCGASGDPLGAIDLALNPDWAARMNDVDYEVIVAGKRHELSPYCYKTSRLYAVPADGFTRAERTATADDMAIGQTQAGAVFTILPALDAIDRKKRIDFFAKDPRVLRTSFEFEPTKPPRTGSAPVKEVHDVLAVEGFDATSFRVVQKRAIYTFEDGKTELVPHASDAGAGAGAAAGAEPDAGAAASTASPPPVDKGSRWVYLAAVMGLVVGGLIAFYRKKQGT